VRLRLLLLVRLELELLQCGLLLLFELLRRRRSLVLRRLERARR
jgi:hypothetical protein